MHLLISYIFPAAALAVLLTALVLTAWRHRLTHKTVIESTKDAIVVLDTRDRVVNLNPAARHLVRCETSKVAGRPFAEIFHAWPELVELCHSSLEVDNAMITSNDEASRYYSLCITPLYRRNGRSPVTGRVVVLHDITRYIQAERALKESEERFRRIFAEVPIGIAVMDLEGHLLQVNKAFSEMLGYDEQELIGLSLLAITHPDDVGADMLLAGKALSGEIASYKVEKRYLKKNQEILWADLTATILRNQKGEAIYGLVMLENIIERKRAKLLEEERYHVAYELHDGLAQVTVGAYQHLQALASRYHPRSSQTKHDLDKALELTQRSVREARRLIAGLRPTILDDFGLAMALRLLIEAQRNDGWTIIFDEALGPGRLPPAIETTLFGVAQEALTNARKHSHTTRARLALKLQDSTIRLEMQDWGCGFEPRTLFKVYRPGEHVGIRAMQERVELLGGHLLVTSQPTMGTLVVAEIPLLQSNGKDKRDIDNTIKNETMPLLLRSHLTERDENDE